MSAVAAPAPPSSSPTRLTAAEFAERYPNHRVELVNGVVQEVPVPTYKHGTICFELALLIGSHVRANDLGYVAINDSWVQTGPHSVRGGDICYTSYERIPKGKLPDGLFPTPPDLVVEVRSPSNRWNDLVKKAAEYIDAGVRVVVLLDPRTASATVYRADELQQIFHNGDELTLPDVLPGFAAPVSQLFV